MNRIFSLRCHPKNNNICVTGGWDGMMKIYDLRQKCPIASIGGFYGCGDSIDLFDDMIVTGSTRNQEVMQMFSLSQMSLVHTWDFNKYSKDRNTGHVLATRISKDGNFIFAGGAGKNDLRVFANNCETTADFKLLMEIKELPSAVTTIDVSPDPARPQFTLGCSNGQLINIKYDVDYTNEQFEPY